jgi:small subunit ribosomal protein S10e
MCLLRSFCSKGYLTETFNWGYYYYYLTNEGIDYLRQYLALPSDIVPATLKASAAAPAPGPMDSKKTGAPGEFKPSFGDQRPSFGDRKDGYRT